MSDGTPPLLSACTVCVGKLYFGILPSINISAKWLTSFRFSYLPMGVTYPIHLIPLKQRGEDYKLRIYLSQVSR
jgi:hypothetical protein